MNLRTSTVNPSKPRSPLPFMAIGAVICAVAGVIYTKVIAPTYQAEGAIAVKDTPSLSASLPMVSSGGSALDSVEGVVSSATAEYYIFYATPEEWRNLEASSNDFSARDPFNLPSIVQGRERHGSITTIKRSDRQQLIIRAEDKSPEGAIAIVNRALAIADRIGSSTSSAPSRIGGERLQTSINRVQNELTAIEQSAVKKGMQSVTGAANASDLLAFRAKVQGLRTDLKSILAQMETIRTGASALSRQNGQQPTGVASLDSLRQQVIDTELKLKLTSESLGPTMPEVELLRRQLNKTRQLLISELGKYGKAVTNNMDPIWLDLQIRADALKTELSDAEKLLRSLPQETLTNAKLIREQHILEQTLIQLRTQYEMMIAKAEAPDKNWIILDKPHITPLGRLEASNKSFGKNGGAGFLIGGLLGYLLSLALQSRETQKRGTLSVDDSAVA